MKDIFTKFDLTGRVALVTGGAGLLGKEFTRTLAEAGAQVVTADQNETNAVEIAQQLSTSGNACTGAYLDVTMPDSVIELLQKILVDYKRLDILVNSAALDPKFDPINLSGEISPEQTSNLQNSFGAFENYPLEAWQQALEVNLTGMFLCCQAAVKPMLAQNSGVIINISSIYGLVGPDQRLYENPERDMHYKPVYYSVTKAGVLGLTRYLAAYFTGTRLRVNALTPGGVFNQHDDHFVQAYSSRAILGRMAYKDEMNGALLFLASDASSYMTGANLIVDGGWTAW